MTDVRPRSTVLCEWAQVLTALLAVAGFVYSVWSSQRSLELTAVTVGVMQKQIDQAKELHELERRNAINPDLQFFSETVTVPYTHVATGGNNEIFIQIDSQSIGRLTNFGTGIAHEAVVEWQVPSMFNRRAPSPLTSTDVPADNHVSVIELPSFLTQLQTNGKEWANGYVYIRCRNQDDHKIESSQHVTVERLPPKGVKGEIRITFKGRAKLRWGEVAVN